MDYSYIGSGDVKFLDKAHTKLGAFLEIDTQQFAKALERFKDGEVPEKLKINVLPSTDNTCYHVKLMY